MFERPQGGETAVLVHIAFSSSPIADDLQEFEELAKAAGAIPLKIITGTRHAADAKYFVGSGKAEEIAQTVLAIKAELVIFNHALSPAQERNLERLLKCRVVDRRGLILDIFAQRARTFEGKLQVELAQLQHMSTRLVRGWTHLERQKGGIGLRGPGETQLESDRRLIRNRIKILTERLEKVRRQRAEGRKLRQKSAIPTIALVGYTNAGKSTLFNTLTGADVLVADQLFATLDPTLRRISLPEIGAVVLADTVGFIHDLPHDLVEAFRATLEETRLATLLLHVIDAQEEQKHDQIQQVNNVLKQIDASDVQCLQVYNKIDLLPEVEPRFERDASGKIYRVWVSAVTGAGIPLLNQVLVEMLSSDVVHKKICLSPKQGRIRSDLYAKGAVLSEEMDEQGNCWLDIQLHKTDYDRLLLR